MIPYFDLYWEDSHSYILALRTGANRSHYQLLYIQPRKRAFPHATVHRHVDFFIWDTLDTE